MTQVIRDSSSGWSRDTTSRSRKGASPRRVVIRFVVHSSFSFLSRFSLADFPAVPQYCLSNPGSEISKNPLDATGGAALALKLLQKSALQAKKSDSEYYFCVDESISRRRFLASQLQNIGYPIEWCIKALSENRDEVMSSANWLALHAPKRA